MADGDKLAAEAENVFRDVAVAAWDSVVHGSSVTGAPGQPVRTKKLLESFGSGPRFANSRLAFIESTDEKAIYVEIDARGIDFKTGGPHGLKLTEMRFQPLIDASTQRWQSLVIGP